MPLYDYKCPNGHKREVSLRLADLHSPVYCQKDGQLMVRQISAPMVVNDYPGYACPVTDRWIEGRKAHIENLKRTGCRILEPGESDAYRKKLARDNEVFEEKLEETADELITGLSSDQKDHLAAEMEAGVTATIERSAPTL